MPLVKIYLKRRQIIDKKSIVHNLRNIMQKVLNVPKQDVLTIQVVLKRNILLNVVELE